MSTPENKPENKSEAQTTGTPDQSAEKSNEVTPQTTINNSPDKKPSVPLWVNISIYISTIFFPLIGIAMGFTYLRKDDPEMKRAGRNWLILGVVVLIITILLISIMKKPETGL